MKPNQQFAINKRNTWAHVIAVAAVVLAMLALPSIMAADVGPKVIKPDAVAFGRTYGEWAAAWEQWADSIPVANHPLFDNGDCSVGQSGPVWFLGGKFCSINNTNCGTDNVVRSAACLPEKLFTLTCSARNSRRWN